MPAARASLSASRTSLPPMLRITSDWESSAGTTPAVSPASNSASWAASELAASSGSPGGGITLAPPTAKLVAPDGIGTGTGPLVSTPAMAGAKKAPSPNAWFSRST